MKILRTCTCMGELQLQWTSQAVIITKRLGISRGPRSTMNLPGLPIFVSQVIAIDERLSNELLYTPSPYLRSVKDLFFFSFHSCFWIWCDTKLKPIPREDRLSLTHKYLTAPPRTWEYKSCRPALEKRDLYPTLGFHVQRIHEMLQHYVTRSLSFSLSHRRDWCAIASAWLRAYACSPKQILLNRIV